MSIDGGIALLIRWLKCLLSQAASVRFLSVSSRLCIPCNSTYYSHFPEIGKGPKLNVAIRYGVLSRG
ncbi:hypothetical protein YC2023_081755 [Brassica napus]